ncbi:NAD(P)-binding protein [Thozetella sp. PMI_491]|nr:NAD(P)-binding protein [Thozetella sp. PMI_491]
MAAPIVYVTGATGTQGGAVARQLRALGWNVRTTTRDPNSSAAKALSSIGVEVTAGAWDDEAALRLALAGSQYLFLNLIPNFTNPNFQLEQARIMFRFAGEAGVKHLVYSSDYALGDSDPASGDSPNLIQLFRQSKRDIEKEIPGAVFDTWTVLRPGFFMANCLQPKIKMFPGAAEGTYTFAFPPDTELPLIDHEDIGKFAVAAFQDPRRFHGHSIRLAGQVLTANDVMTAIRRATGRNVQAIYLPKDEVEERAKSDLLIASQTVVTELAGLQDPRELEKWGIALGTLEQFFQREKDAVEATYKNVID